ncbi:ABC transporter permease [Flavobacterium sp.]|uniref:ABC transporter permease n=1 Tax=Flavobacterium sp. TaxID=239 RepID=UPI001229C309|nr:ABC transporter permease [Flavobacterium sp.]RZJ71217.1 MAG: ABC transporter permease [Flavobacterium sp.]
MKRLLAIEFQKLWLNKWSRVLTIAYFAFLCCIALVASIKFNILGKEISIAEQGVFNFPYIWHINTYIAAWLKLFLALIVVSMVANEYSYGTLKQNLIDGMSKKEFILSKFGTIVVFSVASTVFIFVVSLILGLCFSSFKEMDIIFSGMSYLFGYFLKLVCFFSICLFAGVLVKRSAFALGALFIWWILEFLIQFQVCRNLISDTVLADKIANLLPFGAMGNLIKEPFTRFSAYKAIESSVNNKIVVRDYSIHWYEIAIVVFWIVFFVLMSYKILKKRDL